jgi:hypothetical protein
MIRSLASFAWCMAMMIAVTFVACGPSVTRVVRVPGFQPEEVSMSPDEGALIDRLLAEEPKTKRCAYWKEKLSETEPSKKGALKYIEKKGGGVCSRPETSRVKQLFDAMSTGGDVFKFEKSEILVATEKGTVAKVDTSMGGEMHVFAVGFDAVTLDVTNGGYPVSTKSPYETPVNSATKGQTDSRMMQVNAGADLPTKVVGGGCAVLLSVRKL